MNTPINHNDVHKVVAEAEKLIEEINSAVYTDIKERNLVEVEKRLQNLKSSRARMKSQIEEDNGSDEEMSSYAEGYHEAYQEIVKAIGELKEVLT